ncbi:MAG TPA: SAM-dependent methyltransferase, partial [Blastocatellia bacterium]|nr:SAM-dependent methyltransferase [Blastocatellia bacterium]
ASFNAEMNQLGRRVISFDPLYTLSRHQIESRVAETYRVIVDQCKAKPDDFIWTYFKDADALGRHRLAAMRTFLEDFEDGLADGRYLAGELPVLDLANNEFDLALCSHFLFLYSDQLSLDFHITAISEMCRIGGEVRIFPLLALDCRQSPWVVPVMSEFQRRGFTAEIVKVPYEFQRGGDAMMRITKDRAVT